MRVAMADMGHIIIGVEIALAFIVPDPRTLATHQMKRPVVEEGRTAPQGAVTPLKKIIL
ncbi:hypothetical protein L288_15575 [Sphingobium quisquiliarum P25]|uniref:Uncharacterized protein n=1 Tax=Sphingobium quisquiliarum P25 TaxID=1329909 RepID=T0GGM1_9SPHN|nr:hypothetical protein L288_15575 [Sphingobium quisquiliarum P25]